MNFFTFQSVVDIDGKITTATLLHSQYVQHLDGHAKDLLAIIPNQSFYFECLGKLTHAFLNGLSCLIFLEDTIKEVYIIENISVWRSGKALCVKTDARQSMWTFWTKADLDMWETQLLLVQQALEKSMIPPKLHLDSPPSTPTRDNIISQQKFGFPSLKNNRSWLSFHKHKKQSKEKLLLTSNNIQGESKNQIKPERMSEPAVKEVLAIGSAEKEPRRIKVELCDAEEEVEILVTNDIEDEFQLLRTDEPLSLDFEDQPDIFSDFKILL